MRLRIAALILMLSTLAWQPPAPGKPSVAAPAGGYPDASNTGYAPTGVTLTAYTGPTTITVDGTTIDSKNISSCLLINADNVTIKRSYIHCTGFYVVDNFASESGGGTNLVIEDTTIDCQGTNHTGVSSQDYTLRRVNISQCENGLWMQLRATVVDSFIHNLVCYNAGTDPHIDGIQLATAANTILVQHNRIYGTCDANGAGDAGNAAVFSNGPTSSQVNVTVTNNILAGGGWTLYCNQLATGTSTSYTNNRFSTHFTATVGTSGLTQQCSDEVFTGNVCHESGAAVTASTATCAAK